VRPLVPEKNRISVFKQIHGIAHAGARATQRLIAARFVWPKMLRTFDSGFEIARIVHVPRCSGTHTLHLSPFSCPGGSSLTSMLTWLGLFRSPVRVSRTFSQWWTGSPAGRRPCP
jgi:hypothetical protein